MKKMHCAPALSRPTFPVERQASTLHDARSTAARSLIAGLVALLPLAACGAPIDAELDEQVLGTAEQPNICGGSEDFQNIILYDGSYGVSEEMVDRAAKSVVHLFPTNSSCTGTLIARNIVLTAGHCNVDVGDEVWFNDEIGPAGFPLDPTIHTVTEIIAEKYDVSDLTPEGDRYDYALLKISGNPASTFGYLRIADEEARAVSVTSQPLAIIGYPGDYSKVVAAGPYAAASPGLLPNWFGAQIDTLGGSSGASVLRRDGQIVGVHTHQGCGPSTGNNNMRMPVLFDKIPMLKQVASMQGVSFANVDNFSGVDAVVVNFNRVSVRQSNGFTFQNQQNWTSNTTTERTARSSPT